MTESEHLWESADSAETSGASAELENGAMADIAAKDAKVEGGVLYLVAVPIGNLGDFTPRALSVLRQVDFIACEEVQATRRLLNSQGFSARLVSYRESGREGSGQRIISNLLEGQSGAYVSGAGTPAVSDPGRDLVERCHAQGIPVVPVPGASALTCAIMAAGLPCRRFIFEGFVPRNDGERHRHFAELASEKLTMVFYEAPHRIVATAQDMLEVWGERRVFLGRELTKRFEQCWLTDLPALVDHFREVAPRGECVLVVEGCPESSEADRESELDEQVSADLEWLEQLGLGAKACAEVLCRFREIPRNKAKRLALDYFKSKD